MDEKIIIQQKPAKSPAAAGLLALIPFGTGAFYNGQYLKGLFYMITFIGLLSTRFPAQGLFIAGFVIFQFFETIQSAKAINTAAGSAKRADGVASQESLPEIVVRSGSIFWGIVLMAIGVLVIMANFDVITWEALGDFWPVAVIVIGVKLVFESVVKGKNGGDKK